MLRRLFILASTASLVLCVLTAVLWVRSYQAADAVMFRKDGEQWRALSERGQLRVDNEPQVRVNAEANEWLTWPNFLRHQALDRFEEGGRIDRAERAAVEAEWAALGATFKPKTRIVLGSVRHGWVVAGAAVLPAARVSAALAAFARKRSRRAANRCHACGYDLRATPDRCPECGAVPVV